MAKVKEIGSRPGGKLQTPLLRDSPCCGSTPGNSQPARLLIHGCKHSVVAADSGGRHRRGRFGGGTQRVRRCRRKAANSACGGFCSLWDDANAPTKFSVPSRQNTRLQPACGDHYSTPLVLQDTHSCCQVNSMASAKEKILGGCEQPCRLACARRCRFTGVSSRRLFLGVARRNPWTRLEPLAFGVNPSAHCDEAPHEIPRGSGPG